ncbi:competence/damage-inducible protein A [Candidatus Neomarinimicrobiota bacterium]
MNAAILTIGDELLAGFTVDTNAAWIGQQLLKNGIRVTGKATVGDDLDMITRQIADFDGVYELVIITGGLGPTGDDITKSALCKYFTSPLHFDEAYWQLLVERFTQRGYTISENNRGQAEIPDKAETLPNPVGSAQGLLFTTDGTQFVALPGVPREMQAIFQESVLPRFTQPEPLVWTTIHTTGMGESMMAQQLEPMLANLDGVEIAFLPDYTGTDIRLTADDRGAKGAANLNRWIEAIQESLGSLVYGRDDESMISLVFDALSSQNQTVAVAESCSGGLIASQLTDVAGATGIFKGGVVAYSNESKTRLLDVEEASIAANGAVSEDVTLQMAIGVRKKFEADWGLSTTGIAGPSGGSPEKPVGLVYIAVASESSRIVKKYRLVPARLHHKRATAMTALNLLRREINSRAT